MLKVFVACCYNDLHVLTRCITEWLQPVIFFIIFTTLFGIGLGFNQQQLIAIAPAIIWIAFLFTSLSTIENLLRKDKAEGTLEQLLLSPHPLWWLCLAKSTAFWVVSALPLLLITPCVGFFLQLSSEQIIILLISLLLGSPALTLLGVLGATLTITLPRPGIFLSLLLLPLYVPLLILGESTVASALSLQQPLAQLALLTAISILALTLAPHAMAIALKATMD